MEIVNHYVLERVIGEGGFSSIIILTFWKKKYHFIMNWQESRASCQ